MGTWFGPQQVIKDLPDPKPELRDAPLQSTALKAVVLRMDRDTEYIQAEIRKVLDGLNAIPGLRIGDAFTMRIDDDNMFESNDYKIVLEFERKRDG